MKTIIIILLLILLGFSLGYSQSTLKFGNATMKSGNYIWLSHAYSQLIESVTLDSAITANDSLNAIIVFGVSNFDSSFIDTCRTGGGYINFASIALGDTADYNDFNIGTTFALSDMTYYIRVALQDNGVKADYTIASVALDLTPDDSKLNYALNHLLY